MSRFLITLPLIAASTLAFSPRPLWAAATPIEALELLAKSRTVEAKCRTLGGAERDELSRYAARAEVAVSQTLPLADVRDTIATGKMLGGNAACDAAAAREIAATLDAARRAMAVVDTGQAQRERVRETSSPGRAAADPVIAPDNRRGGDLASYGREAMAYYVERRCTYLARHNTRDFYNQIVRRHQAVIGIYGGPAVGAVLRRSQADAADVGCGQGRDLVASAYSEIRR